MGDIYTVYITHQLVYEQERLKQTDSLDLQRKQFHDTRC